MNGKEVMAWREQLGALAKRGQFMQVTFFHDAHCPCVGGLFPLAWCSCEPWAEANGTRYQLNDELQLVAMAPGKGRT
jgi:hypothetical protein